MMANSLALHANMPKRQKNTGVYISREKSTDFADYSILGHAVWQFIKLKK